MVLYPYVAAITFDGVNRAADAVGQIFAKSDSTFSAPLTAVDAAGVAVELKADSNAILPTFFVEDHTSVVWVSGDWRFPLVTSEPVPGEPGEQGVGIQGVSATGDQLTVTLTDGTQLAPVPLPTAPGGSDAGVAEYITTPGTETNTALTATIASAQKAVEAAGKVGEGWWDKVFEAPTAADTPTITIASGEPTGTLIREKRLGNETTNVDTENDPSFLWDGAPAFNPSSGNAFYVVAPFLPDGDNNNRYNMRVTTITSLGNSVLEIRVRPSGTAIGYRISVDGKWLPYTVHSGLATSTTYTIRLTFPTGRSRKIMFEHASNTFVFGGMAVPAGQTLARPAGPKLRVAHVGASFVGGSGSSPEGAVRMEVYARMLAKLLGADSFINLGIGSTGWTTDKPFGNRVIAAVDLKPDVLIIEGSRNDSPDGPTIRAAVTQSLDAAKDVPRVYVIGPATTPGHEVKIDAVRSATLEAGRVFIDPAAGGWLTSDLIGPDGIHPTFEGHKVYAAKSYEGIGPLAPMLAASVPAAPVEPVQVFADTFTRADSTTSLGSTEVGALPWTITGGSSGNPVIASGVAGYTGNTGLVTALVSTSEYNGTYKATLAAIDEGAGQLIFRATDWNSYLYLSRESGSIRNWTLWRRVAGTNTLVKNSTTPIANGDQLEVTLNDSSVSVKVNGVEIINATVTELVTSTKHGFGGFSTASGTRWDNFDYYTLAA